MNSVPAIFISYQRADRQKAQQLHAMLEERGVYAWYDVHVDAGADWRSAVATALEDAPIFVLLFSRSAAESDEIRKELAAATFSKKVVIPVRIEDIRPTGAFLYELASRHWFDAFDGTTARLAILADQLATLVKGGPDAAAAAKTLGAPGAQRLMAPPRRFMRRLTIAILAAGALIVLAGTLIALNPPSKPATSTTQGNNQRIAFFGLTAPANDVVAAEIGTLATDETFKALDALGLDTASRSATQGVALPDQSDVADDLLARYSLGGEVRAGDRITISIRMNDVQRETTAWEDNVTGIAADKASLPYLVTSVASNMASCYLKYRASLQRMDDKALKLVSRLCKAALHADDPETAERARELAAVAPDSAWVQANFAAALYNLLPQASTAEQPGLRAQLDAALQRALAADPSSTIAQALAASLAIDDGKPLAASESVYLRLFEDHPNDAALNNGYALLLSGTGRNRDALRYARAADRLAPQTPVFRSNLAAQLVRAGQTLEARQQYEENAVKLPGDRLWMNWMTAAVFAGIDDPQKVLQRAPAEISGDSLACWRDMSVAMASHDQTVRREGSARLRRCQASGSFAGGIGPRAAFSMFSALGDIDAAFASARDIARDRNKVSSLHHLLDPVASLARADVRFLPLMRDVGLYQYWLDSSTHPDVCDADAEKNYPLCAALRTAQAK